MNFKATFGSFSSNKIEESKKFYGGTLGIKVEESMGGLQLCTTGRNDFDVFIYPKDDHQPATFTVLNFVVEDVDKEVDELKSKGVVFEEIDFGNGAKTDEKGIMRGKAAGQGPDIAWFKDPAGNFIAVMEE